MFELLLKISELLLFIFNLLLLLLFRFTLRQSLLLYFNDDFDDDLSFLTTIYSPSF